MSTTIDERVVEMRFDNQDFERNVGRTMSTLERLKQKLNLTGASKGLDSINTAAKNVNMNGLGAAVDTVTAKFSALQVMGTTALVRITNHAMAAGERMAKSLTIAPVGDGWKEYEMTLNAVQTTMAATGKTSKEVEEQLKKLDEYADKTVYGTADMLNNLPKFTNAGVDLEKATTAMIGIANATALAGGDASKASIAFYNLGQAIGTGYLTRMDYNSINNAGIATMEWKNQMVEAAIAQGTLTKVGEDAYQAGNKTLTLQQLFIDGLQEQWATTDVMMKVFGDYGDETTKIGKAAYASAQDIKTFTMMMESLQATAGTGWKDTWQIIFGGLEEAKEFWTGLSDFIGNIITGMSDFRNELLRSALGNRFLEIGETIKSITKPIENSAESIKDVVKSVEDYAVIVDDIIGGKWGTGQERWDKLAEAGYDWAHAQNLVNEKLGSSVRHATEYKEVQNGVAKSQEKTNQSTAEYIASLTELSDAQLKDLDLTPKQIEALRELEKQSEKTGIPIEALVEDIDLLNGRTLLINGFKNAGNGLLEVFRAIKDAWQDIFPPRSTEEKAQSLYDLIAAFHKFSTYLTITDETGTHFNETGNKLVRIFRGIFAAVDLVTTVIGGGFKIAFKLVSAVLKYFGLDALEVLAIMGDAVVTFRNCVNSLIDFDAIVSVIIPGLKYCASAIKEWVGSLSRIPAVEKVINKIRDAFSKLTEIDFSEISIADIIKSITNAIKNITKEDFSYIGEFIWDGIIIGLGTGAIDAVKAIVEGAKQLIIAFCDETGIESPSKVFMVLGGFIISGLILGIKEGIIAVPEALKEIIDAGIEAITNIDLGAVMAIAFGAGLLSFFNKIGNALENFSAPFAAIGDVLDSISDTISEVGDAFKRLSKSLAFSMNVKAIKNLAIAIAVLAGTVVAIAFIIEKYEISPRTLQETVGMIVVLAAVLGLLALAMSKLSDAAINISGQGVKLSSVSASLLAIAGAIAILSITVKLLGSLDPDQYQRGMLGLYGLMLAVVAFVGACQLIANFGGIDDNIGKISGMMIKMSIAMLLMVVVCKLVGKLETGEMIKGALFATALLIFVTAISDVTRGGDQIGKVGGMMVKMAIGLALMVMVCKLVGKLDPVDAIAGFVFAMAFTLFVKALVKATTVCRHDRIAKLSGLLISISFSMMLMVAICKLVGKLSVTEMVKGAIFVSGFLVIILALVEITKISSNQQMAKVSGTILAVAGAIAIMALVSIILSVMKLEGLVKGVTVVTLFGLLMIGLVKSLKGAQNVKSSIIAMAVAIGIMAAAVGILSFIKPEKLIAPTLAMSMLMGMFTLMIKCSKKIKGSIGTIITLTVAMGLMAVIIGILSAMNVQNALQNAGAVSMLMLSMSGALFAISNIKVKAKDALKAIGLLTAMVIPMMAFVAVLYFMPDITSATKKVALLTATMVAMSGLLAAVSFIGKSGLNAIKGIGLLTAMVVPMMAFVAVLYFMPDISSVKDKIIALTTAMTVMTVLLGVLAVIGNFGLQAIIGVGLLTAMVIPMMAFVAVLYFMPDITAAEDKVIMLTTVMVAMTVLLGVLTIIGIAAPVAIAGIVLLASMGLLMVEFVLILHFMPDITTARANIELLIETMSAMVGLLVILSTLGPMAMVGVGALAILESLLIPIIALAGIMATINKFVPDFMEFLNSGLDILIQIAGGIGEMVGAFISGALTQISSSLPEIGTNLSLFMTNMTPFIAGAKAFDQTAIDGVKNMAAAIVLITAADLISCIMQGMAGVPLLPDMGKQLSQFMINAMPFVTLSKSVDADVVNSAKSLAEIILILTAADLISGIASLIPGAGGVNFETLGSSLKTFAEAVVGFSDAITAGNGVNPEAIGAAVSAGELMLKLQNALPRSGGWIQEIIGEKDLKSFAASCIAFGQAMIDFSNAITGGEGIDCGAIEDASKAGMMMSELQNSLPRTGGWIHQICGEQDLVKFGASCTAFGKAMCGFSKAIIDGGGIEVSAAKDASKAGEILVALQDTLPRTGGWAETIMGAEDLGTFGESCKAFGQALTDFCTTANIDQAAVDKANAAGQTMIALQEAIPESKWFDGKMDLEDFGKKIKAFGEKLVAYSDEVVEMDTGKVSASITAAARLVDLAKKIANMEEVDTKNFKVKKIGAAMKDYANEVEDLQPDIVSSSITSANRLISLVHSLIGLDPSGIPNFKVKSIGAAMKEYNSKVKKVDSATIDSSIASANRLTTLIRSMVGLDISGVGTFKQAVTELGSISFEGISKAFEGSADRLVSAGVNMIESINKGIQSKQSSTTASILKIVSNMITGINSKISAFANAGKNIMARFATGLSSQRGKINSSIGTSLKSAVSSARNYYKSFYSAGSYLVSGFANGISANSYKAAAKARAMAKAAYEAAKDELDINSPSKIFRALAYSVPEGFAMGIDRGETMVKDSAVGMSDTAINSVRDSISRMYAVLNGEVDMQPTIRPVLDLSDVESGAGNIASLFGSGLSLDASANLKSVNSLMARRSQNGMNGEVISAIDRLRKDLGNVGGTTYQINGITYDDGSNIASAVEALTRAAKIERRT